MKKTDIKLENDDDTSFSLTSKSLFNTNDLVAERAMSLLRIVGETKTHIVAHAPYPKQVDLSALIGSKSLLANEIILYCVKQPEVNCSDNYGMTLLHQLLWNERPDLASLVVKSQQFTKINFKFSIPIVASNLYASALDLSISLFMMRKNGFDLNFIETLLQYGALPPNPTKKFLHGDFISAFYPIILFNEPDIFEQIKKAGQTKAETNNTNDDDDNDVHQKENGIDKSKMPSNDELVQLLTLLARYGFSIEQMKTHFHKTLFEQNHASEFESSDFPVSRQRQETVLNAFFEKLDASVGLNLQTGVLVEMNEQRLDNGKSTLNLPYDSSDPGCTIV